MDEPLSPPAVRRLILAILISGEVRFTSHALDEMAKDSISRDDVYAVLRGGVVEPGELERGSWRYRVRVALTYVVIAFRSESALLVVTAWRKR
ncbi:MAG: DUF4258 domain-containing protein [Minicystis sp.]